MNLRLLILLLIASLTVSFNWFKTKPRDHVEIASEIRAAVSKKLAKKHNMKEAGISGGMMGSVYMIGVMFQINHPMDRDEARARIVDCAEELLTAINENKEIRPYLKNYPFTTKNIKVAIFINDRDRRPVRHPNIGVVSVYESDDIHYYTKEENQMKYKSEIREPYAEALAIVKGKAPPKNLSEIQAVNK